MNKEFRNLSDEQKNNKDFILQAIEEELFILEQASDRLKNDKNFMLQAIKKDYLAIKYASEKLKNDKMFIVQAVEKDERCFYYASEDLRSDKEFVLQIIEKDEFSIEYISDLLKNDKSFMLQVIEKDYLSIGYASDKLKNDEDFILQAIEKDGLCLSFASELLRNDKDFMLLANQKYDRSLAHASDELKNDKDFILQAVEKSDWALAFASDKLRNDRDFVLQTIKKNSWCLRCASEELRNDKELVLEAMKKDSWFFIYAGEELRKNNDFILQAVTINNRCLEFVNEHLRKKIMGHDDTPIDKKVYNDKNYMLNVIKDSFRYLGFASDELKNDKAFMLKAIEETNSCFVYASENLKEDKDFILKILEKNYLCFLYVSERLRNNREFMLNAIDKNAEVVEFASNDLRNDKSFMLQAIEKNNLCFVYSSDNLKNDKEFMLNAIKINPGSIEYAKDVFRNDSGVILSAIKENRLCMSYASYELRNDKEFMLQAIEIDVNCLKYASDNLKNDKEFMLQAFKKDRRALMYLNDKLKNDKDFLKEIKVISDNTMILEYGIVGGWEFKNRNKNFGIIGILKNLGITVLEENEINMWIVGKFSGEIYKQLEMNEEISNIDDFNIIKCVRSPLSLIERLIDFLDANQITYFISHFKLHIGYATKEKLRKFDNFMIGKKQDYCISQFCSNKLIIEYTEKDIENMENEKPLSIYINDYLRSEKNNLIFIIKHIKKPEVMLYIANMIRMLNDNNNMEHRDFIAITPDRNNFYKILDYSMQNGIEYIYQNRIIISDISENNLNQIETFLKGLNVKYSIMKRIDDVILNIYPKNKETNAFIYDVLNLNDISYYNDYMPSDIDSSGESLWMFSTSKDEKVKINDLLKLQDELRIKKLKELEAPNIIIENEYQPIECNYGIITDIKIKKDIENILQSLKLNYCILDSDGNHIDKYEDSNPIN